MRLGLRALALLGAVGVAWILFSGAPREVTLVYQLPATPRGGVLELELRRASEVARRAEFRLPPGEGHEVRHAVRLPTGAYTLAWRLGTPEGDQRGERPLEISEAGAIVLALTE